MAARICSLDDAINQKVRCTDGRMRLLTRYDGQLGYYKVPIGEGVWMDLSGTYLHRCRELFIGGEVIT